MVSVVETKEPSILHMETSAKPCLGSVTLSKSLDLFSPVYGGSLGMTTEIMALLCNCH